MAAYKKCSLCGEYITVGTPIPFKGKFVHDKCFNIGVKSVAGNKADKIKQAKKEKKEKKSEPKPKAELKDALTEEEYQWKKQFYEYLNINLGVQNSPKIYTLVDKYRNEYGCNFELLYKTLVYLNDISDINLTGDVVGLIPYYYAEADKWFRRIEELENNNKDINVGEMYKEKTIHITKQQKKNRKLIDITSI